MTTLASDETERGNEGYPVPMGVRLQLGHAAVQSVATAAGIDLLHIKGSVADRRLPRSGTTDVDVIVRPSQADRFVRLLGDTGWAITTGFRTGSPFQHAATMWHDAWGYADVHRFFPGMEPGEGTFDTLWSEREYIDVARQSVGVPSYRAQVLIAVLNNARNHVQLEGQPELQKLMADAALAGDVNAIVDRVGARVAYSAATGHLEEVRHEPSADLWRVTVEGGTRLEEWRARVHAAPTVRAKAELALSAALVNTEHLEQVLGRRPSRVDVVREFFDRPRRGVIEEIQRRRAGR